MSLLHYLTALVSTAWRVAVLVFLRILPSTYCKKILPPLWLLYVAAWYLTPVPPRNGKRTVPLVRAPLLHTNAFVVQLSAPLTTLALSLPSPSFALRTANFAINLLLLLGAAEFTFFPFYDAATSVTFTRLGAIYPDAVNIVVRYPIPLHNTTQNEILVSWRQASPTFEGQWQDGPTLHLTSQSDWVDTARLGGLWPSTTYEYRLQNGSHVLPYPAEPIRFKTFPDPRLTTGSHFRFLVSSCTAPNFPYLPFQGRRIKGFDLLAEYLWSTSPVVVPSAPSPTTVLVDSPAAEEISTVTDVAAPKTTLSAQVIPAVAKLTPPAEFMLFLGDFIYADVPLYFGDDQGMYRQFYRRNYQSPSFRKVYERLPIFYTYDDHDIKNNYVGLANDSLPPFQNASNAYRLYNADANYASAHADAHYYDFRYGDVAFFVMDTRRYRSEPSEDPSVRTMLGDKQLAALYDWLGKVNGTTTFKFIVSSVPFTSLWQMDAQVDSWAAYAHEKAALLSVLHTVPNVVVLSGDRHEFAAIEFNGETEREHRVLEVSTSPMSMFWIPLVRTLRMRSEESVVRRMNMTTVGVDGEVISVEEVAEEVPKERVVKYIPEGNYKFSSLEVDTRDLQRPVVHLEVVIHGQVAYKHTIHGEPVQLQTSTALGTFVPQTFKDVLDKLGLSSGRWF
ncbi:hypothetical protein EUX98_g2819 [Antrodiella citrinella]|uniref:PhoD-like phosphatase metallophosphatase domain-containing protein n=1 Tax=Antrodiella citrinella TaxID=2447956 RepID=A0A4S4MY38_9APHY|nr:hypothetical protein EUX98_g2819 [Antrodiella citrinella]